MKRALLPTEEYYRPALARELRDRAARLRRWGPVALWLSGGLLAPLTVFLCATFWVPLGRGAGFLGAASFIGIGSGLSYLSERIRDCADRYCDEGAALEAEHQVRYGARSSE